jgi:hypothetical protein
MWVWVWAKVRRLLSVTAGSGCNEPSTRSLAVGCGGRGLVKRASAHRWMCTVARLFKQLATRALSRPNLSSRMGSPRASSALASSRRPHTLCKISLLIIRVLLKLKAKSRTGFIKSQTSCFGIKTGSGKI